MKPIHVAATIVRLFAICLFVYTVTFFINSMLFFVNSDTPYISIISILVPIVLLVLSLALWNFPVSICRKITGIPLSMDEQDLSFKKDEFLSICIFVLGIYFLYDLIGSSVYWFHFLSDPLTQESQIELSLDQKSSLWILVFKSVFVFLLLAGNRLIVKMYNALKYGG